MASVSGAHSSRSVIDVIPQFPKSKIEVGSVRLRPILGVSGGIQSTRFPKLEECAHFHYDSVELPQIQLSLLESDSSGYKILVKSGPESWTLIRSFHHFTKLDQQLHKCVFARSFSELPELTADSDQSRLLPGYVKRLDAVLKGSCVSCGPVLTWFELDNRGRRLVASGHGINTPAVAAAFATSTYTASANDELSFQIGDMISVIDMPPAEESVWWRGKRGFLVGFFPSHCVAVITGKIPTEVTLVEPTKPVLRKHGKLIAFFRAFILSRPSRRRLKQSGILKERVFGCDLSEHLLNSARDIPLVLKCCAEFIESHGIVDGIYRLSGVTSNIQKLRSTFDEDRIPALMEEPTIRQDIHSVASLLKMYFRELPNPLCTYQLYDEFVNAVQSPAESRLENMIRVVRKLPPPHYRTLEYLMGHLGRVSDHSAATGMTARNVAIVWAPNLLRCKSLGVAALQGVGVQALVTEFLVLNYRHIFSNAPLPEGALGRPKSLVVSSPTKLLSLEEAQARELASPNKSLCESITTTTTSTTKEPMTYHTVLELPRKRHPLNWRTFFTPLKANSKSSYSKHKSVVKSAEYLGRSKNSSSQVIPERVGSTHSRSVSHDSYFDTNLDQPSTSSLHDNTHPGLSISLDLSELHMNFDMDESEMKIFSEDETNQLFSSGASIGFSPLENENALEDRFSNQEIRYIDSYSPDPMETGDPTALGYVPLLTPSSCGDIKVESTKSISPFPYEKMTESNDNSRKSDTGTGESSRKSDGSTMGYDKLESSPEGNVYEPCGVTKSVEQQITKENNLYESMEADNIPNVYENETVVNKLKRDAADNIYEDIQVSSTQEIYEQVSYLRSSVEEVNRLIIAKQAPRIGPPPSKELKKSISLERIQVRKIDDKRFSTPMLAESSLSIPSEPHIYEPIAVSSGPPKSLDAKLPEPVCSTDYENVNFTPPAQPQRKMSEETSKFSCTVVSELLKSDVKTKKTSVEEPKEVIMFEGKPTLEVEIKGKTDKLRKFFEQDSEKKSQSNSRSSSKESVFKSPVHKSDSVNESQSKTDSNTKLDINTPAKEKPTETKTESQSPFKLKKSPSPRTSLKKQPDSDPEPIKPPNVLPLKIESLKSFSDASKPKLDLSKEADKPPKQDSVMKSPVQEKCEFFQSKEKQAKASRKFEPLQIKSVSPTNSSSPESPVEKVGESEAERRERIEKYKEERRNFFRNKYKMEKVNNNDDEELIRRIKERTKGGQRKPEDEKPTKTTVSILYSPTRTQAPSWNSSPEK